MKYLRTIQVCTRADCISNEAVGKVFENSFRQKMEKSFAKNGERRDDVVRRVSPEQEMLHSLERLTNTEFLPFQNKNRYLRNFTCLGYRFGHNCYVSIVYGS